ncbi:Stp1/IreP family PP2C-type Ser/Thr phosphatase [Paenibacillus sp. TRM 82003]|uniref:Stp1/IreP family PP2C-type Ser/Thr phosphatase n=1 Tax=Kineococcus sp. TRM81007 TaxID=2925831 RepID=UPI001F588BA3|nr:Stp1/IreP family PP2C-type Ser/Thr phosphatase [Kineococcus sp. TRM81007]MCI2237599.1 Stp1/IreP family PP2C-type Ser/Thr phosphatase [Kineococcus sp. TRM81007]MCI3921829.1 Stp1/IreP family PP2C-type Ser/Thr phosphatase [Paenibacillus sp. TRM 82003]
MAIALRYAARSDVGLVRSTNQDSGYAGPHLLVVADGMGGHAGGDVASSLAVGELASLDGEAHGSDDAAEHLHHALDAANEQLRRRVADEPELAGMGTTVTAVLRAGSRLVLAHIGDSRGYLLRDGRLTQLTRDHSYVQSLIDEGRISAEEAERHPQRSVIMRVLTGRDDDTADVSVREARPGDRYLLCSDGLSGVVSHETLERTLAAGEPPDATCERLVELALRGGGPDNVSCVVADVVELGGGPPPSTTPQVVGAAAFHRPRRSSAAGTPAARAAALRTAGADDDDQEDDDPGAGARGDEQRRRRARWRWIAGPLLLAVLLAAGAWGGWRWSQQQYFVGVDGSRVALFQGLTQDIGPVGTSSVVERTDIAVADLPSTYATLVTGRISASGIGDARETIAQLEEIAADCRAAAQDPAPSPTGQPTAEPTAEPTATSAGTGAAAAPLTAAAAASTTSAPDATTPGAEPTGDAPAEDCGGVG